MSEWQPIETAPRGRKLIAGYHNRAGKWRTVMACYYDIGTLPNHEWDLSDSEWSPPGWYEESETYDDLLPTDEPPTHWMPLPEPPK